MDGPGVPESEQALYARASELSGFRLAEIAARFDLPVPPDLRRAKGWVGELMERALGATARSRAAPDFEELGIELKTLPVAPSGLPAESTFVCTIDLDRIADVEWPVSLVRRKLARVLWVPVEGGRSAPCRSRVRNTWYAPFALWSPSSEDEADLRADWEELAGCIGRGDVETVTGHMGKYLQKRLPPEGGQRRRSPARRRSRRPRVRRTSARLLPKISFHGEAPGGELRSVSSGDERPSRLRR